MIPEKDKTYKLIYNKYRGEGVFTGEVNNGFDEPAYGFKIPVTSETCWFFEEDILGEASPEAVLKDCVIVAADRINKTITVELPDNDCITGICLGQSSKILIKNE